MTQTKVQLKRIEDASVLIQDPIFHTIAEEAQRLGYRTYVVGGYVRDRLLQRPRSHDVDILCDRQPDQLVYALQRRLQPKPSLKIYGRFRTASLFYKEWKIEFVGARKESYTPESRKPSVAPATIEEDFLRRDFTINALAISLNPEDYGWLIDPFTGIQDLRERRIRTPINPHTTFYDDPLRMLRAIRFATVLNFHIDPETFEAIRQCKDRIQIVSPERIADELQKIMQADTPHQGILLLYQSGLLELILPEVHALAGVEEREGFRHKDNFLHTLQVLKKVARHTTDVWTRWAALLHDIGKPLTKQFDPKEGWTFHGHDIVGARLVRKIFRRLRLPLNEPLRKVETLVRLHQRPVNLLQNPSSDSGIRRLIYEAGNYLEDLLILCEADITTKNPRRYHHLIQKYKKLRQRIQEVEEKDRIRNFQPPITGHIIMEVFGIGPSRIVGEIKNAIKDAILDGKIPNDFVAAWQLMIHLGEQKGLKPRMTLEEFLTKARKHTPTPTNTEPNHP